MIYHHGGSIESPLGRSRQPVIKVVGYVARYCSFAHCYYSRSRGGN
jgi:hypothetical protein